MLDVLDVGRIEILRGPQGTLFGRNTIGGAISIISKKPAEEFSGNGEITVGSANRRDIRLSVDVPISEKLLTRVAFSSKNRDGYVRGLQDDRRLGNENRYAVRFTALYNANDDFRLTLNVDSSRIREQNAASTLVGITETAPAAPGSIGPNGVPLARPGAPSLSWVQILIRQILP